MPRRRRSYLPGHMFHITSRIIAREHWILDDIRDHVVEIIEAPKNSDARIVSHCVMSNHIHLVVRQGDDPLGQLMHNIKHRIARVIQRRLKRTGCIFERRFYDKPCSTPSHLRAAIAYTHLNPWTAGMCEHPKNYSWSSHPLYCNDHPDRDRSPIYPLWEIMAPAGDSSLAAARATYCQLIEYLMAKRRIDNGELVELPPPPRFPDEQQLPTAPSYKARQPIESADIRDLAVATLLTLEPRLTLEDLREGRTKRVCEVRHEVVRRCTLAGHRPIDIASFVRLSPNRVSEIAGTCEFRAPRFFTKGRRATRQSPETVGPTGGPPGPPP
jgi:putative transposase